jgi:hypothetical protein
MYAVGQPIFDGMKPFRRREANIESSPNRAENQRPGRDV